LELIRQHVAAAYSGTAERTLLRQLVQADDLGVVRISVDGGSIEADDRIRNMLAEVFTGWSPLSQQLPDELRAWMVVQLHRTESDPGTPLAPLVIVQRSIRLTVRLVPETPVSGPSLIIRHVKGTLSPGVTRALGLSLREAEVLEQLMGGASSAAIADALVVSRHTVNKHLQNVYAKLGVRSRTAAIAKVRTAETMR